MQPFCMIQFCMIKLLILTSLVSNIVRTQPTAIKTAILTPLQFRDNGASVMFNVEEVLDSDTWDVNILHQNTWQFIIRTDESFGIGTTWPAYDSTITLTVNIQHINTKELLFAFTTDNNRYVSISIPVDGSPTKIYPACSITSTRTQFAFGDIASIPATYRSCDIAGGSCNNWKDMYPPNIATSSFQTPITFTIRNNVFYNEIVFSVGSQTCRFANDFVFRNPLKIYIAGDQFGQTYSISSFNITSAVIRPTTSPTMAPTQLPTHITTSPTQNPSLPTTTNKPSTNPTPSPTQIPTTDKPSLFPTNYPIFNPTHAPVRPTKIPSKIPINDPSQFPTRTPTRTPTQIQTDNSITPTKIPSNIPSSSFPTQPPTQIPTANPTQPSEMPTMRPSFRPTPFGMQFGPYNQLCKTAAAIGARVQHTCVYGTEKLIDTLGLVNCVAPYDCCMCKTIECGFNGTPCEELTTVGEYGMYGVKEIYVIGDHNHMANGVNIDCQGAHSCGNAVISGTDIGIVECGEYACQNALITIIDPKTDFVLDCAGISSCEGLRINIILPDICQINVAKEVLTFNKIACNADRACEGLQITVQNNGCHKVIIQDLECIQLNACNNAAFNLIGDIAIRNCNCGPSCDTATGLDQCFMENINLFSYLCHEPNTCNQETKTIQNPRNGFEFICNSIETCRNSNFIIELNDNPSKLETVNYLEGFLLNGDYAGYGSTFVIDNKQRSGNGINVNEIECGGYRSCEFTTFIIGTDTRVRDIICSPDACSNCYIKETVNSPGIPCDPSKVSSIMQI